MLTFLFVASALKMYAETFVIAPLAFHAKIVVTELYFAFIKKIYIRLNIYIFTCTFCLIIFLFFISYKNI